MLFVFGSFHSWLSISDFPFFPESKFSLRPGLELLCYYVVNHRLFINMAGARVFKDMSTKELRSKKKEELLQLIFDARAVQDDDDDDDDHTTPKSVDGTDANPKLVYSSIWDVDKSLDHIKTILEPLLNKVTQELKQEIVDLKSQINDLQTKVTDLQDISNSDATDGDWTVVAPRQKNLGINKDKSFSEVLRQTVSTALREDRTKCNVIISGAPEGSSDTRFVSDLCQTMNFDIQPP